MIKRVLAVISRDSVLEAFRERLLVSETGAKAKLELLKAEADKLIKANDAEKDLIWLDIEAYVEKAGLLPKGVLATTVTLEMAGAIDALLMTEPDPKNGMTDLMDMIKNNSPLK